MVSVQLFLLVFLVFSPLLMKNCSISSCLLEEVFLSHLKNLEVLLASFHHFQNLSLMISLSQLVSSALSGVALELQLALYAC